MRLAIDGQKLGKLQILHLLNHSDDRFVVEVNTDNVMQRVSIRGGGGGGWEVRGCITGDIYATCTKTKS